MNSLSVLYEDNHCLAVMKPARLLTAGDETGDPTLLDLARDYVRHKYHKPGRVFLGLVHRLDRPVSGVVLFARTSKAAARLSEQFRKGTVRKVYQAVVEGAVAEGSGELCDWLVKAPQANLVRRVAAGTPEARHSRLLFRRLRTGRGLTLLEMEPQTGRSHQIRVQLAARGHPIYGDRKYGSRHSLGGAIALHAAELTFAHPVRKEAIVVRAEAPREFTGLLKK
ncbi:MAG: RluA family pseudouridine synthase [Planctomycetaceae bacterium]